jgi:drug/metabolite transporter (DMT)-like permease
MKLGVAYALGSLVCAGALDVVFRRYSMKERSRGMYVLLAGLVWAGLQLAVIGVREADLGLGGNAVVIGCLAGVLIALANILFIESLGRINVSLASTVYRLNTILVVVLAVLLFGEALTAPKVVGVGLGVLGVMVLYHPGSSPRVGARFHLFFLLAVAASTLRALWGIVLKAGSLDEVDPQFMMLMSALGFVTVGAIYARWWEGSTRLTRAKLGYSLATGGLLFLVANLLMLALVHGEASVVVPIANMSFVVALGLSAALRMEGLTARKLVAIGLATAAIVALARAPQ